MTCGSVVQYFNMGMEKQPFNLRHALVLTKLSRYEFERRRHTDLTEQQLENVLRKRGSDYDLIIRHHYLHKEFEERVKNTLLNQGIETRVVDRFTYNEQEIAWADIVFAAGGDGTFLHAASRISDNMKPVVGLNSDPLRSEGYLCLPKCYSSNLEEAISRLKRGDFEWKFRSRIRITLVGEKIFQAPMELHEQELLEPQNRYFACMTEQQKQQADLTDETVNVRRLPVLALNEVFIGENLSARVSLFELKLDDRDVTKVKSSGLCVSTGTGSTSWHLSINRLTDQSVLEVIRLLGEQQANVLQDGKVKKEEQEEKEEEEEEKEKKRTAGQDVARMVASKFNEGLVFSPEDNRMCYTIRDLISAGVWPSPKGIAPRDFARRLEVRSRCYDAGLVVDGGVSFAFNDGTVAILEIHPQDALRTVRLRV